MKRNEDDLVARVGCTKNELHDVLAGMGIGEGEMDWCSGVCGVPITYLDRHCPAQFEIVGMCENLDLYGLKTRIYKNN